jgi:hypothetical protein
VRVRCFLTFASDLKCRDLLIKPIRSAASARDRCRFGASLQVTLNLFPDFAICASNLFRYGAESDATDACISSDGFTYSLLVVT